MKARNIFLRLWNPNLLFWDPPKSSDPEKDGYVFADRYNCESIFSEQERWFSIPQAQLSHFMIYNKTRSLLIQCCINPDPDPHCFGFNGIGPGMRIRIREQGNWTKLTNFGFTRIGPGCGSGLMRIQIREQGNWTKLTNFGFTGIGPAMWVRICEHRNKPKLTNKPWFLPSNGFLYLSKYGMFLTFYLKEIFQEDSNFSDLKVLPGSGSALDFLPESGSTLRRKAGSVSGLKGIRMQNLD